MALLFFCNYIFWTVDGSLQYSKPCRVVLTNVSLSDSGLWSCDLKEFTWANSDNAKTVKGTGIRVNVVRTEEDRDKIKQVLISAGNYLIIKVFSVCLDPCLPQRWAYGTDPPPWGNIKYILQSEEKIVTLFCRESINIGVMNVRTVGRTHSRVNGCRFDDAIELAKAAQRNTTKYQL